MRRPGRPARPGAAAAAARQPHARRRGWPRSSPARPRRSRTRCRRRGGSIAGSNLPRSSARRRNCPGRDVEAEGVLGGARARPLPRPLPAAAAPGLGRDGPGLARPRRAERPRRRAEDRRPRGQGGLTAPSARRAPPPSLRHERCQRILSLARDSVARLHRLRVRPGPHAARGDARRRARRPRRDRGRGADLRGARARPRQGDRPPRREAVERPARRVGRRSTCGCSTSASRRWRSSTR